MVAMAETGHDPGSFTSWFFGAFMGVMAGFVGGMVLALSSYVLFEGVRGALNWRAENLEESLVPSEASGGDQLLVHARNLLSALDYPELDSYHQDIEPVLASLPQLGAMMGTVAEYQNQGVPVPKDVQSAIDESLTAVASVAGVARREMDRVDAERAERVVRLQMLGMKELDGSLDPEVFTRAAVLANMVEQVRTDTIKRLDAQQIEA
jgi:hypothetical protein